MIKKLVVFFLLTAILTTFTGCTSDNGDTGDTAKSEYQGVAQGYLGDVTVTVKTENNKITEIKADAPDDTPEVGGKAVEAYNKDGFQALIGVDAANADISKVDTVSGATMTSNGVKEALKTALDQAK